MHHNAERKLFVIVFLIMLYCLSLQVVVIGEVPLDSLMFDTLNEEFNLNSDMCLAWVILEQDCVLSESLLTLIV